VCEPTDIDDIVAAWDTASGAIETVEIPLERSDVEVDPLRLLWLPVGSK